VTHLYAVEDGPKMLRETLSAAQGLFDELDTGHRARLQRLIDECERKRPTGPDGSHGGRHTDECGCGEPRQEWAVRATKPGKEPLLMPCPTEWQARAMAAAINEDRTSATAEVLTRPATGWSPA